MNLGLWFHRLLHPHCQECKDEIAENRICESCETLKMQLAIANAEKRTILDSLLEKNRPEATQAVRSNLEELKPKQMTWNVRRQMLEAEDRKAAELLRKKVSTELPNVIGVANSGTNVVSNQSIESLEKELGVEETDAKPSDLHGQDRAG